MTSWPNEDEACVAHVSCVHTFSYHLANLARVEPTYKTSSHQTCHSWVNPFTQNEDESVSGVVCVSGPACWMGWLRNSGGRVVQEPSMAHVASV